MTLNQNSSAVFSNNYTYDNMSRIATVSDGSNTAAYTRVPGTNLLNTTTITAGGSTKLTTARNYDSLYRMTSISSVSSVPSVVKTYSYTYDAKDRRTQLNMADGSSWVYGYDDNGQIVSGVKHDADGKAIPGQSFGYDYDGIGNLTAEQRNIAAMNITYTANNVNQYTSRTFPSIAPVIGEADPTAAVKAIRTDIRDPGYADTMIVPVRDGKYFSGMFHNINNATAAVNVTYDVYATKNDAANNQQLIKKQSESFLVPKRDQSFSHDYDGNMLSTGVWNYTYNAENRPITVVNAANTKKFEYAYDFAGRRVVEKYSTKTGADWTLSKHLKFVYNGFKKIAEYDGATETLSKDYTWGGDAPLWVSILAAAGGNPPEGATLYYIIDGNKNVRALVDGTGALAAEYEYGPFGDIVSQSGAYADSNPYRFSSEYFNPILNSYDYGLRDYRVDLRRWGTRDPIEELGGVNLYAMVGNNPVDKRDWLGLRALNLVIGGYNYNIDEEDKKKISKITTSLQQAVDRCRKLLKDDCPCKVNVKIIDGDEMNRMTKEEVKKYDDLFNTLNKANGNVAKATYDAKEILKKYGNPDSIYILIITEAWALDFLGSSNENDGIILSPRVLDALDQYVVPHELGHNGQYRPSQKDKYDDPYDHSKSPDKIMYPFSNGGSGIDEPYCKALLKNCR